MTVKGRTTPACAACNYQRRKCSPTCPLAPYFPANQPKIFQNVHRLFGVSNVTKTLHLLNAQDQSEDAMRSIIYEADMRHRFPVDGCCAVIAHLHHQLDLALQEMRYVCANLDACRDQVATNPGDYDSEATPPPHYGCEGFLTAALDPVSSIQAQMEAFGIIQTRNTIDFEAQQFNTFDDRQLNYIETKDHARDAFDSSLESSLDDAAEYGLFC